MWARCTSTRALAVVAAASWLAGVTSRLAFGRTWSLDLRVYRAAGHALYSGAAVYTAWFTPNHLAFTYPPFALLVLSPLSLGPEGLVAALWWAANAAALVAVVYLGLTAATPLRGRRALAAAAAIGGLAVLVLEPVRSDMDYGQINLLLMLLVVGDALRLRGRGRGVLVGLAAALKLTPLVYLGYFLVRGEARAAARGASVFVVAGALSWAVLPGASARYWLHQVRTTGRIGKVADVYNQSWAGLLHRSPVSATHGAPWAWALCALVTMAVALLVAAPLARAGAEVEALFALALAELLVSPISWTHHWSWLVLAPVVMARPVADRVALRSLATLALAVAVVAPYTWLRGGWLGALAGDSLTLAGALLLIGWAAAVRTRVWRRAAGVLPAG